MEYSKGLYMSGGGGLLIKENKVTLPFQGPLRTQPPPSRFLIAPLMEVHYSNLHRKIRKDSMCNLKIVEQVHEIINFRQQT